jgi:N-acetyl-gamma-glutamyl-phosphate reductase
MDRMPVAVVGASGYTGVELLRLLVDHPRVALAHLSAHKNAGARAAELFPSLAGRPEVDALVCRAFDADEVAKGARLAFLALPHGESVPAARALLERGLTVLDLSADFRLRDAAAYEAWYGPHAAKELLSRAVYGLPERHRGELPGARLVAVPGCYPTATILALAPLLEARLIRPDGIVVDAKSGVSGAGRSPTLGTHFSEVGEGVRAYKVAEHRHTPEIEQELSLAAHAEVTLTFTPHLVPMSRGILSTCYALPVDVARARAAGSALFRDALRARYEGERFVQVIERPPDTAHVRGSNRVHVGAWLDARAGRVIAMAAIDNLVKGAAGQAVQAMNAVFGWPESTGIDAVAVFP